MCDLCSRIGTAGKSLCESFIADDGSAASEMNIKSVEWKEKAVVVVLQASEMDDREIVLEY